MFLAGSVFLRMKQLLYVALVILLVAPNSLQQDNNPCKAKVTCGECIVTDARCAWCSLDTFPSDGYRCNLKSLHSNCDKNFLVYPNTTVKILKAEELADSAPNEEPVQIKPQRISIRTRPKTPVKIKVEFRQAKNYPVDLYYLMDLSYTMKDDLKSLDRLGEDLAKTLGKITNKFRLGFGSFVDKVTLPFTDTEPMKLKRPCVQCEAPYGFHNHMPLKQDTDEFKDKVKSATVSGNLDAPEGGLDAVMQVAVCKKDIGWRNQSRKLLVFATDSVFHYAGDGRLAGILKPNDGECHLDADGFYSESLNQDYPSIRHLNQKIEENNINVIFAVTRDQSSIYSSLSKELEGSTTGELSNDSSNVIQLIQEQYNQITSSVELKNTHNKDVHVTYYSSCLSDKIQKTNMCTGLQLGVSVIFEVDIEVISCSEEKSKRNFTFQISPVGLSEALTVDMEVICECDCEKEGQRILNSPNCSSGNGNFECGICNCHKNRYGQTCQCNATDFNQFSDVDCRKDNSSDVCSRRGECKCGVCECHPRTNKEERIYGKYCECDNFSCAKEKGQFCGGPDKGKCNCGKCECNRGWKGPNCKCEDSNENCRSQDGKICSDQGTCECNSCNCQNSGEEFYSGAHCEECPTCPTKCQLYKDCVECHFVNGSVAESCSNCSQLNIKIIDKVEAESRKERVCSYPDAKNCRLVFKYVLDYMNQPIIHVQRTRECPTPVNAMAIGLGVTGGVIGIGLALLLILKLLTLAHDKREWAKFEKERQMAKWDEGGNPIYKQPTSTFMNPTYNLQ